MTRTATRSIKTAKRLRRHRRIRVVVAGDATRPRISVFRSNTALYLQLVDDARGVTVVAASSKESKESGALARAKEAGKLLAQRAKKEGITAAVFDRSGYVYTGKIKAAADGAREGGLSF